MKNNGQLIKKTFFSLMLINAISMLFSIACTVIDTIVTGRFLGTDAVAAAGLVQPVLMALNALAMLFGPGISLVCSRYIGKAMKERVNQVFTLVMTAILIVFATVSILLYALAPAIAAAVGGSASAAIVTMTADYLRGYAFGVLPMNLSMTLASLMMLDNDRGLAIAQMLTLLVGDVVLDLLNVLVFHGGMWGMAVATSVSQVLGLLVILTHFLKKNRILHLSFRGLQAGDLAEVMRSGIPNLITLGGQTARSLCFNFLLLTVAGSGAVAAMTVGNTVMSLVGAGLAGAITATATLTSLLYGEEDRNGLAQTLAVSLRTTVSVVTVIVLLLAAFARPLSGLFLEDGSEETLRQAARFVRFITLQTLFMAPSYSLGGAYMGVKQLRLNSIIALMRDCVLQIACTWSLTKLFGLAGFEISLIVSAILLLCFCIAIPWVKNRRFPRSFADLLMLPDSFGPAPEAVYAASAETVEDVMKISQEIQSFCRARNAEPRLANLASLFVEEMAKNTVTHGFNKDRPGSVDIRLVFYDDVRVIRFRDNGMPFNPVEWLEKNHPEDPASGIGIRMIVAMAKDVNYISAVGWNNLMITL